MKKNLLFILACVYAFSLNAINGYPEETSDNEVHATVAYFDLSTTVYNSDRTIVTADVVSSEATILTFRFILANGNENSVAYFNVNNNYETSLSRRNGMGSDQITKEVPISIPAGRFKVQIRMPRQSGIMQTAVMNIIQPDGQTVSPFVLTTH